MVRFLVPSFVLTCALALEAHAGDALNKDVAQSKHAAAVAQWEAALQNEPSDPAAALALAESFADLEDAERDVGAYERAVKLLTPTGGPDLVKALRGLAKRQAWHGDFAQARTSIEAAVQAATGADKAVATAYAGHIEHLAGDLAAAKSKFESAVAQAGSDATGLTLGTLGLAEVEAARGNAKSAAKLFAKAKKSAAKAPAWVQHKVLAARAEALDDWRSPDTVAAAREAFAFVEDHPDLGKLVRAESQLALGQALVSAGEFGEARQHLDAAVDGVAAELGADSPAHALARTARARANLTYGDYAGAEADFAAGLAVLRAGSVPHPGLVEALSRYQDFAKSLWPDAARLAVTQEALAVAEATRGADHPTTAKTLLDLGKALDDVNDTYGAYLAYTRARAIFVSHYGEGHFWVSEADRHLAYLLYRWGFDDESIDLYAKTLLGQEASLGKKSPMLVELAEDSAAELSREGLHDQAAKLYDRAHALAERAAPRSLVTFQKAYEIGYHLYERGMYADAVKVMAENLEAERATLAPTHNEIARSQNFVAYLHDQLGQNAEAEKEFLAAIEIYAKNGVPVVHGEGTVRRNLGNLYVEMGNAKAAREQFERAARIWEAGHGPMDTSYVDDALKSYSAQLEKTGDSARSSRAYARQVAMNAVSIPAPDIAFADATARIAVALTVPGGEALAETAAAQVAAQLLNGEFSGAGVASEAMANAMLLHLHGRKDEAARLTGLALELAQKNVSRPQNERGETTVTNLDFESAGSIRILAALVLARQGDADRARTVLESAAAAFAGSPRKGSYSAIQGQVATAAAWFVVGDQTRGQTELETVTKTYENTKLANPTELVASKALLSLAWRKTSDAGRADALLGQSTQACEDAARCGTPNVAWAYTLVAWERKAAGDQRALDLTQRALDVWEQDTDALVEGLQDHERKAVNRARAIATDLLVDLETQEHAIVLGSILRTEAARRDALLDDPQPVWEPTAENQKIVVARDKVRDLRQKLARYAAASFDPAQGEIRRFRVDQQVAEVSAAEAALAEVDPTFAANQVASGAMLSQVCKAMPAGSVLVHTRRHGASYSAYIATPSCAVDRVDLAGTVTEIDAAVNALRNAARTKDASAYAAAGKDLAARIWEPVEKKVGGARTVFFVADGSLAGVPLAGLPRGSGWLVDRHAFVQLDAPGDLVRWKDAPAPAAGVEVFAGIDPTINLARLPALSASLRTTRVAERCGASPAVSSFALDGNARTGADAIEAQVTPAGALVFHTGFLDAEDACQAAHIRFGNTALDRTIGVSPLLRTGIVLSGSAPGELTLRGNEDGIWTAEEIAGTDLRTTRTLVVSTGDDSPTGAGVRALYAGTARSGARALVLPLWAVDTVPGWLGGIATAASPTEALRSAQLAESQKAEGKAAPWTWAAWTIAGDGR